MVSKWQLILLSLVPYRLQAVQLEEALLFDMFPSPSNECLNNNAGSGSTTFTFDHSPSESYWHSMSEPHEQTNFLAEMTSTSSDANKSWKMRIGQSGNFYSFRGAYGEAVPPQFHVDAPFIDEIPQLVAVDQSQNGAGGYPYFIHQSGVYTKDSPYVTNDNPFYSPSIAKVCKDRSCVFASWGQQAHLKTVFKGAALYYTMYTDCGEGVFEFSQIIHNAADNGDVLSYLNVPWAGPRQTTLRSFVQAKNNELENRFPLHAWGNTVESLSTLDGYTIFAENLLLPEDELDYELPEFEGSTVQLIVANKNSHTTYMSGTEAAWGTYAVRTELKATVNSGAAGCRTCFLTFVSADQTGENGNGGFVTRVLHWSWDGVWLYHFPIDKTASEINSILTKNTEILVSWSNDGDLPENNLSLTHVYGWQTPGYSERFAATRTRYGTTTPGRDYLAYTVNTRLYIDPGETYHYRQYFISGQYTDASTEADKWTSLAGDDFFHSGEMNEGSDIEVYSEDENSFAVTVAPEPCHRGELRCTGKSVPGFGLVPLFFITCGSSNSYLGSDRYNLAPDLTSEGEIRAYACDNEDTSVRPTLKLIGYFEEGSCLYLENADTFLDFNSFCTASPSFIPSITPTISPRFNPNNQDDEDDPSFDPPTLSEAPTITPSVEPSTKKVSGGINGDDEEDEGEDGDDEDTIIDNLPPVVGEVISFLEDILPEFLTNSIESIFVFVFSRRKEKDNNEVESNRVKVRVKVRVSNIFSREEDSNNEKRRSNSNHLRI